LPRPQRLSVETGLDVGEVIVGEGDQACRLGDVHSFEIVGQPHVAADNGRVGLYGVDELFVGP
jgi:hypothetical protein